MKKKYFFPSLGMLALGLIFAVPAYAQTLTSQMDIGATGSDVTALQQYLAQDPSIYPEGLVTGYYGSLTAAAVSRWQTAHGIASVGRVGPLTLAQLNTAMSGIVSGGDDTSGSSGDIAAPVITGETVATTSTSATITWSQNEAAHSRVMYGTSWPFLYATAPSASDSTFDTFSNVTISGLQPNTVYYYIRESVDGSGNITWTTVKSFRTNP